MISSDVAFAHDMTSTQVVHFQLTQGQLAYLPTVSYHCHQRIYTKKYV
jgi:hypothetical protein